MLGTASSNAFLSLLLLLNLIIFSVFAMADESAPKSVAASSSETAVHIVYTERPLENEEPESYHIRTLASVLGRSLSPSFIYCLFSGKTREK